MKNTLRVINALDTLATLIIVRHLGTEMEWNPIAKVFLDINPMLFLFGKTLWVEACLLPLQFLSKLRGVITISVLCGYYAAALALEARILAFIYGF